MRMLKNIFILCFFLVFAAGCETYKDYDVEYSPVYPLSGEWLVKFIDSSVTPADTLGLFVMSTYNTADNSNNQMWIRITSNNAYPSYTGRICGKINCDVAGKTFSGENVGNTYFLNASTGVFAQSFTITGGTVIPDGATAPSGTSDKISFTITDTRKPGKTFTVEGWRRTRWTEDEPAKFK